MPAYDYKCKDCNSIVTVVKSISAPHPENHDGCGGTLTRLFTSIGVTFNGNGFYKTDNRKVGS